MSLSTALNIAQSALQSNARQTATVSRNITSASDPDYNRRAASLSSQVPGIQVMSIQRATDAALFRSNLSATASYEGQYTLRAAIESMTQGINGIEHGSSPAKAIGSLYESLQFYASNPANASVAESAIDAAREVVRTLNNGTASVNAARAEADRNIAQSVADLNQLLADFKKTNDAIVGGTAVGRDVNDALDKRDGLLKQIAALVPVSTITRDNNDIVITTASGAILFETVPREVTFQPTLVYGPNTAGNAVMIDGVPLVPGSGANTDASGRIAANLQMRDDIAPKMQAQLDEIARGLISTFAETDQTGGGAPSLAGLFTWSGGPALPPGGMTTTGLAASISINAAMDSTAGGNAFALRDGGVNGGAYLANTSGAASFSAHLLAIQAKMDQPMAFDPMAGAGASGSIMDYSTSSISWLQGVRQTADNAAQTKQALVVRTAEALSNATGVNVDEELALLIELEHSYGASARLLKAADDMLASLLAAVS